MMTGSEVYELAEILYEQLDFHEKDGSYSTPAMIRGRLLDAIGVLCDRHEREVTRGECEDQNYRASIGD